MIAGSGALESPFFHPRISKPVNVAIISNAEMWLECKVYEEQHFSNSLTLRNKLPVFGDPSAMDLSVPKTLAVIYNIKV